MRPLLWPSKFCRSSNDTPAARRLRQFSTDYSGGYWNFYELSNGGFYMALELETARLIIASNGYAGSDERRRSRDHGMPVRVLASVIRVSAGGATRLPLSPRSDSCRGIASKRFHSSGASTKLNLAPHGLATSIRTAAEASSRFATPRVFPLFASERNDTLAHFIVRQEWNRFRRSRLPKGVESSPAGSTLSSARPVRPQRRFRSPAR